MTVNDVNLLKQNMRSIYKNFDDFEVHLKSMNVEFYIIVLSETLMILITLT